ncbi:MAG TPA: phage virion morphogenesis protein [Sphingopyxis sp.]|nr:phage virion morphogenesis protein [Sphingopyxis sp.]
MENNFNQLETFLGRFVTALSPREMRGLASKIGQSIRRSNAARIATNTEPDGGAMQARRPREGKRRGKMFRQLRQARLLKVRPSADGVTVGFTGQAQKVAKIHHFGEEGVVGRTRDGRTIRARYAARMLLGIGEMDEDDIMAAVEKHLSRDN